MNPPTFLASSAFVALGGGFGAWLRFVCARWMTALLGPAATTSFPWPTLAINLIGSFAMGLLAGWLTRHNGNAEGWAEGWRLLLGVGVLGGFTTFSAFSLEIVTLAQRGAIIAAAAYVALSLAGGIAGLFAGLGIMKVLA